MLLGCVTGDAQCQPDERPRRVDVSTFQMMSTEVTNGQFEQWLRTRNTLKDYERPEWSVSIPVAELPLHPAVRVKWADARAFCQDRGGRLPREDEWEFAARQNRRDGIYAWDPDWDVYMSPSGRRGQSPSSRNGHTFPANIADESGFAVNPTWRAYAVGYDDHYPYTAPVGKAQAIKGIYDLIGNAWEWMEDDYIGKPGRRVVRGGSFSSQPPALRVSFRGSYDEREQREDVGFRCVK
jgi:formylglycine-generating enzyme required for sulfatase activity